ncbi:MAG: hypothetical protein BMS9Abin13_424 [Patescibacteria group bacterium]|nr:MAG: hypothetical protein BMS9Abin13_424 [Patescibacteria group bacterium]
MEENLTQALLSGVGQSFQEIGVGVAEFLPKIIAVLALILFGWVAGAILGRVIAQMIKSLKFDKVLQSAGAEDILSRAGFHLDSGAFLGGLVKWFIIIVFLVAAFDVLGLQQVNVFLQEVILGYLPQVIVAVLILLIAAVLADSMQKVVIGSAKAAEIKTANFLGAVTRWSIWTFAILIALSQLGIAPQFMYTLFTGFVAMLALAGGLAFGIGGKNAAEKYLEKLRQDISPNKS